MHALLYGGTEVIAICHNPLQGFDATLSLFKGLRLLIWCYFELSEAAMSVYRHYL